MGLADKKKIWSRAKTDPRIGITLCAALALLLGLTAWWSGMSGNTAIMAGLAAFMAVCWVTEVVPIPVTSLFPLALFPLFGVAPVDEVAASYGKPVIYLFLGGFLLALGLQRSGVHRRIALWIVDNAGSQPSRLILGFMLASAGLSMWISNTATVLVMLPIALAVLEEAKQSGVSPPALSKFGVALMLGIAYAADIGGMATPVGTPPNLVLLQLYSELVPDKPPLGFGQWMIMGLPLSAIFLSCGWLLLTKVVFRFPGESLFGETDVIRSARESLGTIRRDEWITVIVFMVAAFLWMTRAKLQFGALTIPGWQSLLGLELMGDASVAIAAAAVLFMIPSTDHPGETLLTWKQATDIPWGLLLLFGGGFALAKGFELSGLSESIGEALTAFKDVHPIVLVATVCLCITFLTEVTSNTATTSLILPILAEASRAMGIDPLLLMIPATLSASCAFMMPVASPTQAIVFGSGYVSIRQMVRAGIWFNLLGVFLVTTIFMLVAKPLFGIDW
ncbi:MAG: SLC13 family permease [Pirellulaceae bacterium]